jgi:CelD/BcsL family acetyltransferase involved in cellulose biosynthesis
LGDRLQIELMEDRSALRLGAAEWNALVRANETNTVFQTHEWFDAWWQTLRGRSRLFFLNVTRDGRTIGFAPLMVRRTKLGLRQLEFVGTGNADYQDFVLPTEKPRAVAAICAFLRGHSGRWDRMWLANVPEQSATLALFRESAGVHGLALVTETVMRCPVLLLEKDTSAVRELVDRYSLRRPLNWFSARGKLRFRHVTERPEILSLLPQFFDQHVARWRALGKPSLFEAAEQRQFYVALAEALRETSWLAFFVVEFNDRPIAFHFGFDYGGAVIWYKPSFDPAFAARSPGLLLVRQLIEDALQTSKKELDFTIGDEAFKSRFANHERFNSYVSIYPSRLTGQIASGIKGLRRLGGRVKRLLSGVAKPVQTGQARG